MKKQHPKHVIRIVLTGVLCVLLMIAASWYSVTYNDSRLVTIADLSTYRFQIQDLPMILSGSLFVIYVTYLCILLIRGAIAARRRESTTAITRRISPKFGLLGFLGFAGFLGFYTYHVNQSVFPFLFFTFFGFFGFYYEGKMSDTLMDERFLENRMRSRLTANEISLKIIFLAAILIGQKRFRGSLDYTLIAVLIVISAAFALNIFLSEYLLYHYDHEDSPEEREG